MSDSGQIPPPEPLALGICDAIHRDPGTGKRFILGTFTVLYARNFPTKHPVLGVYLDLTNGRGQVMVKLQVVDCDEEREPVWQTEMPFDFPDPRMVAELDFMIGGLEFPEAGEYRVQAFANGEFLIERRLIVKSVEPQK
jgi:hypothetical protein